MVMARKRRNSMAEEMAKMGGDGEEGIMAKGEGGDAKWRACAICGDLSAKIEEGHRKL